MARNIPLFAAIAVLLLTGLTHADGISDLDGDGVAVTFLEHDNGQPCVPGGARFVDVKIEINIFFAGPPAGNLYRLVAVDGSSDQALLMQVRVPAETIQYLLDLYAPPGEDILSGFFTLSFPLHCDDSCHVEGREDAVGRESFFTYQAPGGPPGPPGGSIGQIGGGGGPADSGITIEAVGSSGSICVDLAIQESEGGQTYTGGDNWLCCGEDEVPAVTTWGLAATVLLIGFGAYRRLRPARPPA